MSKPISLAKMPVVPKPARRRADPLLAALISELPPNGTDWSVDRQKAWLKLMAHALSTKYGGDVAAEMESGAHAPQRPPVSESGGQAKPVYIDHAGEARPTKPEDIYSFFIDYAGFARRKGGERVNPQDVTDTLIDIRGVGDPDAFTVIWANGSEGLLHAPPELVISAVNP
jgi:hypothetical protein